MTQTRYALLLLLMPLWAPLLLAPLHAQSKGKVDFEKQIWPILEKKCISCHQETYVDDNGQRRRPKGRVRLDTKDAIEKSKRGKVIVKSKPDDSLLYAAISLPADDEDRMPPPKESGPLPAAQVMLIKQWIEEGADYGNWAGMKHDASKQPVMDDEPEDERPKAGGQPRKPAPKKGPSPLATLSKGLKPVSDAQLKAFEGTPFQVRSVGDDNPLLTVTCAGRTDDVDDRQIALLEPIQDHITELDLARSQVSDGCCATLAKMPRLTSLDLRQTKVGNQGVKELAACKELRSLNLFDTDIGDYALAALASLKKLEQLYVWQTDVTAKAVVALREALPNARIVFSADLPEPSSEASDSRRRRR